MAESDPVERSFLLARADVYHAGVLLLGAATILQSIVFANAILAGAPVACRISDATARYGVYVFIALFWVAYQAGIETFARIERDYRHAADVGADALAARAKWIAGGMNIVTALFAAVIYSASLAASLDAPSCAA